MLEQSTSTHRIDENPTCLRALHPPFRLLWLVTAFSTMFLAFVSIPHAFIISMVSNLTTRWAGNRANVRRCLGQAFVSSTRTCVIYKHGLLSRVKVFLYFIEKHCFFFANFVFGMQNISLVYWSLIARFVNAEFEIFIKTQIGMFH